MMIGLRDYIEIMAPPIPAEIRQINLGNLVELECEFPLHAASGEVVSPIVTTMPKNRKGSTMKVGDRVLFDWNAGAQTGRRVESVTNLRKAKSADWERARQHLLLMRRLLEELGNEDHADVESLGNVKEMLEELKRGEFQLEAALMFFLKGRELVTNEKGLALRKSELARKDHELRKSENELKSKDKDLQTRLLYYNEEVAKLDRSWRTKTEKAESEYRQREKELEAALEARKAALEGERKQLELDEERRTRQVLAEAEARRQQIQEETEARRKDLERSVEPLERQRRLALDLGLLDEPNAPPATGPATAGPPTLDGIAEGLEDRSTPFVRRAAVLSVLTAMLNGRLVLMEGSVGVGKTSIAERIAAVCGGRCTVLPVRPAWVEPSDLLGYFDPLYRAFRPGPFTEAVRRPVPDRMNVVVLDELNLARIENYASDLLSRHERIAEAHRTGEPCEGVPAWSLADRKGVEAELDALERDEGHRARNPHRLPQVKAALSYTPRLELPDGLTLLGTLNTDETTYDLSPKVIDRSFAIAFPHLEPEFRDPPSPGAQWPISVADLRMRCRLGPFENDAEKSWRELMRLWPPDLMSKLGIPYNHRVLHDLRTFVAVGRGLGASQNELKDLFIFARLLPRLRFHKGHKKEDDAKRLLETLGKDNGYRQDRAWSLLIERLLAQCGDNQTQFVRYWTGEFG